MSQGLKNLKDLLYSSSLNSETHEMVSSNNILLLKYMDIHNTCVFEHFEWLMVCIGFSLLFCAFLKSFIGQLAIVTNIVKRIGVSKTIDPMHVQAALQMCVVGTTALHLWLAA